MRILGGGSVAEHQCCLEAQKLSSFHHVKWSSSLMVLLRSIVLQLGLVQLCVGGERISGWGSLDVIRGA